MRFEHTMRQLMVLIHFQSIHIHELYIHLFIIYRDWKIYHCKKTGTNEDKK